MGGTPSRAFVMDLRFEKLWNGRDVGERYSMIAQPHHISRLKAYHPNLDLFFNHSKKRWEILFKYLDGSGWQYLMTLEDSNGQAKDFGDWVFNHLFVMKSRNEEMRRVGVDTWDEYLDYQAEKEKQQIIDKAFIETKDRMKDDFTTWRKGCLELSNMPVADATAGYRKIT